MNILAPGPVSETKPARDHNLVEAIFLTELVERLGGDHAKAAEMIGLSRASVYESVRDNTCRKVTELAAEFALWRLDAAKPKNALGPNLVWRIPSPSTASWNELN